MGHASTFGHAYAKSQMAANSPLPQSGNVFISVNDNDKTAVLKIAHDLHQLGFTLTATAGTASAFTAAGLPVTIVNKVSDGSPNIVDAIRADEIALIINTPRGGKAHEDGSLIRGTAIAYGVPIITTLTGAMAAVQGIRSLRQKPLRVRSLQTHHAVT